MYVELITLYYIRQQCKSLFITIYNLSYHGNMWYGIFVVVFNGLRWKVIARFADVGGIVDHCWLNFLLLWSQSSAENQVCPWKTDYEQKHPLYIYIHDNISLCALLQLRILNHFPYMVVCSTISCDGSHLTYFPIYNALSYVQALSCAGSYLAISPVLSYIQTMSCDASYLPCFPYIVLCKVWR